MTMLPPDRPAALGPVVVHLLKGPLEREHHPRLFDDMLKLVAVLTDYVAVIGLELYLDEAEGHAFLRQRRPDPGEADEALPRLVTRRPLGFAVSVLCVLLRKKLVEADAGGGDPRVILGRGQIVEAMRVFLPHKANEAKLEDQIERHIGTVVGLGFLRPLKGQEGVYEVRRLLKAFVDADWLADLETKLEAYRAHVPADA